VNDRLTFSFKLGKCSIDIKFDIELHNMKKKFIWLTTVSVIVFLALSAIQGYLIYNTYTLKQNAFLDQIIENMSKFDQRKQLDSIEDAWSEDLKVHIADYKNNRIDKETLLNRIKNKSREQNDVYYKIFKNELQKVNMSYALNYKKNIKSIVIIGSENDTIFPFETGETFKLYGYDFPNDQANSVSASKTFSQYEFIDQTGDEIKTQQYNLEFVTQDLIQIIDKESILLKQMSILLIGSAVIFLSMIALFYYSIKTLFVQKKIDTLKTDFINNITHELKTPLATLGIATRSLRNKDILKNSQAIFNSLNIIERQNDRIQKLIDQVMSNSLSANNISLKCKKFKIHPYLDEVIEDFKLGLQEEDISISKEFYAKDVELKLDKFYFTTALFNLLDNAVKYSENPIIINITTSIVKNNFVIGIKDLGIGISKIEQKNLFHKFYRVPQGDIYQKKGLGLGLYYSEQIIKAHRGTIEIESEIGKGSVFFISIPLDL
jgi:two-component system phosphate regulon sensor histidine kinase PhoR